MERGPWGRAWDRWAGDSLLLVATAAAAVFGPWAGREEGAARAVLVFATVSSVVLATWVKVVQTRREHLVKELREAEADDLRAEALAQRTRDLTLLGSAIKPGIENLARLASSRRHGRAREVEYSAIRNRVVDAASILTGDDQQVRAVYFRREEHDGVAVLVPAEYSGARQPSGRVFRDEPGDVAGQATWEALRVGAVVTWADVEVEAPPGWDPTTRSRPYLTFVMAPVLGPDRQVYGMLNIDALEADTLDKLDEERLAALAALLGAAAHLMAENPDVA